MSFEKILCFGSLNPDYIYFVDEIPKKGADIRSSDSLIRAGGTATVSYTHLPLPTLLLV